MTDHPLDAPARIAKRAAMRARLIASAEAEAKLNSRSIKCRGWDMGWPKHADHVSGDGCKNDGTSCLCECHDKAAAIARGRGETDTKEQK